MAKLNQLHLTVQTLSGTFEGEFESDQKLQDVIDKVLLTLDIKPAPGEEWKLTHDDVVPRSANHYRGEPSSRRGDSPVRSQ